MDCCPEQSHDDNNNDDNMDCDDVIYETSKGQIPLFNLPIPESSNPLACYWFERYKRLFNGVIRLVGIESNPGPPKRQKQTRKAKNTGKVGLLSSGGGPLGTKLTSRAAPGRVVNPRSLTMGFSHLVEYMRCLNDPFNFPPVRPGVACAVPSGLMTCYGRFTVSLGSSPTSFVFNPNRMQDPIMVSFSTSAPYTYSILGPFTVFPQYPAINALYEKVRLLASGVRIIPTNPSLNDGGAIVTAQIPTLRYTDIVPYGLIVSSSGTQGVNEIPAFPQALFTPYKNGATMFWRPIDPGSFVFREAFLTDTATATGGPFVGALQDSYLIQPVMMAGLSGISVSPQTTIVIEFIAHYEGLIAGGNAGVIELVRAPPTPDSAAIAVADKVFGQDNRTSIPSYTDSFLGFAQKMGQAGFNAGRQNGRKGGGGGGSSSIWKDLAQFGSSVAPVVGAIASLF
jgi:hypothetical protein